jgi:uncharacterized protein (DUF58 family)
MAGTAGLEALAPPRRRERPGPGPMPDALLRALDVSVRRRIDGLLAGEHRSTLSGEGSELAQVRPYEPGDDVRRIDWNVTARTAEPHVRVDVADRVLTTWLLLDTSPSMTFGTADRRKADVAEGVALAVGHLASRRGNRLGVVTFGGPEPALAPPRHGRDGVLRLLEELRREQSDRGLHEPSLEDAFRKTTKLARSRSLLVLVSDLRGQPVDRRWLADAAGRHHVVAVEVRDPREQELVDVGELWFVDPETGRQLRVDTSDRRLRERFAERAVAERRALSIELRRAGVDHVVLTTSGDWLRELASFLRRLGGRR